MGLWFCCCFELSALLYMSRVFRGSYVFPFFGWFIKLLFIDQKKKKKKKEA